MIPENKEERQKLFEFLDTQNSTTLNPGIQPTQQPQQQQEQTTIPDTPKKRIYHCNNPQCKKEIAKDVVAYCLHEDNKPQFKGKVYCRECQDRLKKEES